MRLHEGRMGVQEMASLMALTLIGKLVLRKDVMLGQGSGNATWYTIWITALAGAAVLALALYVAREKDLCTAMPELLGPLGKGFLLVFCVLLWFLAATMFAELFYLIRRFQLPNTSEWALIALLLLAFLPLSFFGLESLGRTAKMLLWVFAVAIIGLLLLTMPHFETFRLHPLLGQGLAPSAWGGVTRGVMCADILAPAVFFHALQKSKARKQSGWIALGAGVFTAFALIVSISMLFAPDMLASMSEPLMRMSDFADAGLFFIRFEPLFFFIWFMLGALGLAFTHYSANFIYCRTFAIMDIRPVTALSALLCIIVGYGLQSGAEVFLRVEQWVNAYGYWLLLGPLVFSAAAAYIRRKGAGACV